MERFSYEALKRVQTHQHGQRERCGGKVDTRLYPQCCREQEHEREEQKPRSIPTIQINGQLPDAIGDAGFLVERRDDNRQRGGLNRWPGA